MRTFLLSIALMTIVSCAGIPEGVEPVRNFDLDRYLGTWYELARLDHRFERGLSHVSAYYQKRSDGGIDVLNRGYDASKNRWKEASGRAYFVSDENIGHLKVTFFWPFYSGYNIVWLDAEYNHAIVTGPNEKYLWYLSRTEKIDEATWNFFIVHAESLGFNVEGLIKVEHDQELSDRS